LEEKEVGYSAADELIITRDLRDRKAIMEARANAFVALPGGFGTLEEILEILTLKQLQFHTKPIVLVNTNDFFNHFVRLCEHIYAERFAKPDSRLLYHLIAKQMVLTFTAPTKHLTFLLLHVILSIETNLRHKKA
jgi:uncharacterized protein (TIGR00730 family)